jgi:hypothetical protein
MDKEAIAKTFEARISDSVTAAGARLDPGVKTKLSNLAERAAFMICHLVRDENERPGAIQEGSEALKKLVETMVRYAKMAGSYPDLNDATLRAAFSAHPPLWEGSDIDRL